MSWMSWAAHRAIQFYQKKSHDAFVGALGNLEATQRQKLQATLAYLKSEVKNYDDFTAKFPVTSYADYQDFFLDEKKSSRRKLPEVVRFQPTSGSTSAVKWIPYTRRLLQDFDAALGPWLYDFYGRRPEVLRGPHYWSLSWLPQDLRDEGVRLDDTELFPFWKKILLRQTMAVTAPVDQAPSSEASLFATLAYLLARKDLSFVSVWSPTYWLNLMNLLQEHREDLASSLETGVWARHARELRALTCPDDPDRGRLLRESLDPKALWPRLQIISSWDTSTSQGFAQEIERRWPHLKVVGKGLWATEACVTIPFRGDYVLALNSHFFEFQDLDTGLIYPSWDLSQGQLVSPLVTTSGGLLRYKMQDVLRVTGFQQKTPCFEFLGRADGVDLVGEKTSGLRALEILKTLSPEHDEAFLFAVQGDRSRYLALVDEKSPETADSLSRDLERLLSESFHYRLARELGQLAEARVLVTSAPVKQYTDLHLKRGMVLGNIKMESLRLITENEFAENFPCP
jgi:hypothetical protein